MAVKCVLFQTKRAWKIWIRKEISSMDSLVVQISFWFNFHFVIFSLLFFFKFDLEQQTNFDTFVTTR